nr:hypothetical protein [Tanacetum cinerariifolium]
KVQEVVEVVTVAKLVYEVTASSETVTAASVIIPTAEPQVPTATMTVAPARVTATPSRRRKGVVIRDPESESATSSIISAETKSKDKSIGIMVEEPKPLKKKQQIELDEEYARKLHEELNKDIDWDESIDHVKLKAKEDPSTKEQMKEEKSRALQTINETPAEKAAKKRRLNEEVEDLKRHLEIMPNKDDDLILLVERRYPLIRFTLDQMLNAVRLQVEEESELSLELLSTARFKQLMLLALNAVATAKESPLNLLSLRIPTKLFLYCLHQSLGILMSIELQLMFISSRGNKLNTTFNNSCGSRRITTENYLPNMHDEEFKVVTTAKMIIDTVVDAAQVSTDVADIPISAADTMVTTTPTIEATKTTVEVPQVPKVRGITIADPEESTTKIKTHSSQPLVKDKSKGKAIIIEPEPIKSLKKTTLEQIRADEELAAKLEAEF